MRKTVVIAVREYQAAVKTKAFLLSVILMPIMMGGGITMQWLLKDKIDISDKRLVVIDRTNVDGKSGTLFQAVAAEANKRNEEEIYKGEGADRRQVKPKFVLTQAEGLPDDPTEAALALSEQARKKEILAFLVIGQNAMTPVDKEDPQALIQYHSNNPTYDDLYDWLRSVLNDRIRQLRFQRAGLNETVVKEASRPGDYSFLGLLSRDESGKIVPAERTNRLANFLVPFMMCVLMFMIVMVGASPLTNSVIEEKMQRIAEVLLGSVSPFELMLGKLLGSVGVSLTLLTIYLGGSFAALTWAGQAQVFPIDTMWWFVAYQALAVFLYGSMFIAVGAGVSDLKEAQSMLTPLMLIMVIPMMVMAQIIQEPSSTLSTTLSFIPPFTPMIMPMRQTIPPGVPLWQPAVAIVLVLLATTFCVYAAGRIFRVGILMQGRGAKVGEMVRWIIKG
ncbi:MAG: ABC transporter permease [Planctomycetota bacterium]